MDKKKIQQIPLFPLQVVLFPNSSIKIHVFEEKYKSLFSDIYNSNKPFGITLSLEEKTFNVGCLARLVEISKEYKNGDVDIVVQGIERFKVLDFIQTNKPYQIINVEFFEDIVEPFQINLQNDMLGLYNEVIKVVFAGSIDTKDISKILKYLSYKVAEKIGMTLLQRQKLIELNSETQRLHIILDYLQDIIGELDDPMRREYIIQNDGYL